VSFSDGVLTDSRDGRLAGHVSEKKFNLDRKALPITSVGGLFDEQIILESVGRSAVEWLNLNTQDGSPIIPDTALPAA
jgi:hypothetical protein